MRMDRMKGLLEKEDAGVQIRDLDTWRKDRNAKFRGSDFIV